MVHQILYILHVIGMAAIIGIGLFLLLSKELATDVRKKFATHLMSAAHTQLLTGFALFFLMLSDVNHMKVGIKMLFAIEVAVIATIYRKKIVKDEPVNSLLLLIVFSSAIIATLIAFIM